MFGLSHDTYLLLDAVVTIIGLIVLITRFKVHPFIALIIAAGFLGLTSGMPVDKIIKAFQDGFGGVLGFVGIILALGTMLGKMMADSGGADQIAQTLVRAFGKEKVQWAMMFAAFLVGIPLFFEIGFVLLIPLVFIVARRTGVSLIKIGIPLLAGLSAVHGLVPPHPGPLLAIGVFGADIGKTILYGLIVALPTAIIAGPLYGSFIAKYIPGNPSQELVDQLASEQPESKTLPSFSITLITVLLPVFLMLLKTFADVALPDGHVIRNWMDMIGHPITALLLALLLSLYTFGHRQGIGSKQILKLLDASLAPTAAIILIIGAGGGFKQMLVTSGVGDVIGHMAVTAQINPILLAWLVAAVIRVATGSATVATITGAGIV
ncbi:MAG: GntP family permease, partial [Pseudomonadota bacterium]|nr:GntP family permease [Pseudomonadota bacterium]